jgi:hypothetical protein
MSWKTSRQAHRVDWLSHCAAANENVPAKLKNRFDQPRPFLTFSSIGYGYGYGYGLLIAFSLLILSNYVAPRACFSVCDLYVV